MLKSIASLLRTAPLRAITVLVALGLALAACSPSLIPGTGAQLPATIKVGAVVPLTGKYAAGGEQVRNGYELAVEDINKAGGVSINGKKIPLSLQVLDDGSDPTKTVQQLETLNNDGQVVAYLGGFGSDLHAAAAGVAEKNKIPYIGVAFALQKVHAQGFKYLFSPFPKSPSLAVATFDLLDTLNPKPSKIAIFAEKTDWGAELDTLWKAQAQKRGYAVVADQTYAPGSKDFSAVILPAKNAGAQVVLALPNPPDGLALAKQMKELDYTPGLTIFIRAADGLSWGTNLGKDADYFLNMPGWNPLVRFAGVAGMDQRYQTKYGKPAEATSGPAYAAVQILADAITRAASLDHSKIRDAIAATNMNTVIGPVKFNADGTGQVITVINQWQNGKQVLVWPPDQATNKTIFPAIKWSDR